MARSFSLCVAIAPSVSGYCTQHAALVPASDPCLPVALGGSSSRFLARAIAPSFVITGIGYVLFGGAPSLLLAALAIIFAHMGGSTQWTFSTALIQMYVPDRLRGRIFSMDFVALTLMTSLSTFLVGVAHDAGYTPRTLAVVVGVVFIIVSLPVWLLWYDHQPRRPLEAHPDDTPADQMVTATGK